MTVLAWLGLVALFAGALVAWFLYLVWYLRWEARTTRGMAYYGRPLVARRAIKRRIRTRSAPVLPLVRLLAPSARARTPLPSFEYKGVHGPPLVSSGDVFARAERYRPRAEDVFVATQMRCGTTWMQQIVYETVCHGRGDLSDGGHGHLYAMSPWIDGINSVSMADAPLVGERPTRIIKTHLPTRLCPYSPDARYIYVARNPVSCFASIVDYNRSLLGSLTPPVATYLDWFCGDRMYWLPWPEHVSGWWTWAKERDNVLFVHFEDLKVDFGGVSARVARFLGCDLTPDEARRVTEKCSFAYMQKHEELFEMAPPTMFSVRGGRFLAGGKVSRHDDVMPDARARILEYCLAGLTGPARAAARVYQEQGGMPGR